VTRRAIALVVVLACTGLAGGRAQAQTEGARGRPIVVASKPFAESYLLAEMFAQLLEHHGVSVTRVQGLGSTEVVFAAVRSGSVDVYPEYTGTGLTAVLNDQLAPEQRADPRAVFTHVSNAFASRFGVRWLPPLGFENTFAMAVRPDTAQQYGLRSLSDLSRARANLRAGFTADFIDRPDGLRGLRTSYSIDPASVQPLSPALKYQALASGSVDIIDGFSTDGLVARYQLVVLLDDRRFFPPYEAAAVLSARAAGQAEVVSALTLLSGKVSESTMRELNRRVEVDREDIAVVAASALRGLALVSAGDAAGPTGIAGASGLPGYLWQRRWALLTHTMRHLWLVALALTLGALVAVPLGLMLERFRRLAASVLSALGILQTIPSIALLAFMVPLLGIGMVPALVALWLYALLPMVRATYGGVRDADPDAVEAAEALGMTAVQLLINVRLPLAAPVIMAGVRTAAVITVGAATLAAFIGAGGLGEPIVTGLALADSRMVLSGALPAAALAVVVDGVLALVEQRLRPAHLRVSSPVDRP